MDDYFNPDELLAEKAASRAHDERDLTSGAASAQEINDRNSWAHGLDLSRARIRVRHEMD